MGNTNTISTMNGKPRELNQGSTSTSETTFSVDGTTPIFLPLPSAGQISGANPLGASRFRLNAAGRVTTGTTSNFSVNIYYATSDSSLTVVAAQQVFGSSTVSLASISTNWAADIDFVWDGDSNRLNGYQNSIIHLTHSSSATAVLFYPQTSVDPDSNATEGFIITGTFGTGNASNVARLDLFQLTII